MHIGPLRGLCEVGQSLVTEMKSMRAALPLERLIKVSKYVADSDNGLDGILNRISAIRLNSDHEG
jgi:hypothetical protein